MNKQKLAGPADYIFAYAFFCLWLLPIAYVGLSGRQIPLEAFTRAGFSKAASRNAANYLNNMYRIACLFPDRVKAWGNYYYLVRLQGQESWSSVPEEDYGRLKPFGYRTRLKRMLDLARENENALPLRQAMAGFIKQRYEQLHPLESPVEEVRFVRVTYKVGTPELAKPSGHWTVPPLETVPEDQQEIISTHLFQEPHRREVL
ncbi:MAG: hypothetical protein AB7S78_12505 [Candidatus Omnitrophota bacterium]